MSDDLKERLTRVEERLIAERSIRKTRDDQMFKRLEEVSEGLKEVSESQKAVTEKLVKVDALETDVTGLTEALRANTEVTQQASGSIKTLKWLWPLVMVVLTTLATLWVQNVNNNAAIQAEEAAKKVVEDVKSSK